MGLIPLRVFEYALKIASSFELDHPMQLCYRGITPNVLRKPLSMSTKPFIVVGKEHDLSPSREFTAHNRPRAVSVIDATLLEQIFGNFGRANDNDIVRQRHRSNVAYPTNG
jgi:hypothetical protein